ncbi:MAG: hypothetical protein KC496_09165, partial [Anaerolineae bacterium]|nr:hypothetical protein [Anaerolineae bacterium]
QEVYVCLLREEISEAQNLLTKIYRIALPYQHEIVATAAEHVEWLTQKTCPSTAQLKERIQRLLEINARLHAVLTATLILPTLSRSHPPEIAPSFAAALIASPTAPRWLSQLPIMRAFISRPDLSHSQPPDELPGARGNRVSWQVWLEALTHAC